MGTGLDAPAAVVLPVGPGTNEALDTLASVDRYCGEAHLVVVVDDCTTDGTYEALVAQARPNWRILRNERRLGVSRLVHTLALAYRFVLSQTECRLVFRLDQDALLIGKGVLSDAALFAAANPEVGLFGVHARDYNRPRSFSVHKKQITQELLWIRRMMGLGPSWARLLSLAEREGYQRGDNVFGGAYFVTRQCLEGMRQIGALDVPYRWHSRLMEDVYYSMAAVAARFKLGHFGAPEGPLCLEWRGLPFPAEELIARGYKVVHSVDKGKNTDRSANDGMTAREFFRNWRSSSATKDRPEPQ